MQNVKNFIQGKALGVAEYLTPILKVIFALSGSVISVLSLPYYYYSSTFRKRCGY